MKYILAGDGGGAMGRMPAGFLSWLERTYLKVEDRFSRVFDLIIGTSTDAILGAFLASGKRASEAERLYVERCPEMFGSAKFRNLWIERPWRGKYSRAAFIKELSKWIDLDLRMSQLGTVFIAVADSLRDKRPHFFKSDDNRKTGLGPSDSNLRVIDVIARSALSASYYFEPVDDPEGQQVWVDGGTGTNNCPLYQALYECKHRGWHLEPEGCHILSLGTGWSDVSDPYKAAASWGSWRSVKDSLELARGQCEANQLEQWEGFTKDLLPSVKVLRVNVKVPKEQNTLDAIEFMADYDVATKRMIGAWGLSAASFLGLRSE